jgi:hypothetical protein
MPSVVLNSLDNQGTKGLIVQILEEEVAHSNGTKNVKKERKNNKKKKKNLKNNLNVLRRVKQNKKLWKSPNKRLFQKKLSHLLNQEVRSQRSLRYHNENPMN